MNLPIIHPLVATEAEVLAELVELAARARSYAGSTKAANTRKAYGNDWRHFEQVCGARPRYLFG